MLLGEMSVGYGKTYREEVDGGLPLRVGNNTFPCLLVAVRMVDDKEKAVGGLQPCRSCRPFGDNTIVMLQTPHHTLIATPRSPLGTREKHLGVEPIEERLHPVSPSPRAGNSRTDR